jgi:hypothetical protein
MLFIYDNVTELTCQDDYAILIRHDTWQLLGLLGSPVHVHLELVHFIAVPEGSQHLFRLLPGPGEGILDIGIFVVSVVFLDHADGIARTDLERFLGRNLN